mmetsp:Transcript_41878/g.61667  ORF Transcript_41878/g.61667 Transcript_41878/m.61667 type:complete len:91 (+) Transcript_41878:84-356(+)
MVTKTDALASCALKRELATPGSRGIQASWTESSQRGILEGASSAVLCFVTTTSLPFTQSMPRICSQNNKKLHPDMWKEETNAPQRPTQQM